PPPSSPPFPSTTLFRSPSALPGSDAPPPKSAQNQDNAPDNEPAPAPGFWQPCPDFPPAPGPDAPAPHRPGLDNDAKPVWLDGNRSEEHTSELQSPDHLV